MSLRTMTRLTGADVFLSEAFVAASIPTGTSRAKIWKPSLPVAGGSLSKSGWLTTRNPSELMVKNEVVISNVYSDSGLVEFPSTYNRKNIKNMI